MLEPAGLTDSEIHVLELLADATNAFASLPEHHPSDLAEWAADVHRLQHRVMARAAIRWQPRLFTAMVTDDEGEVDAMFSATPDDGAAVQKGGS